MRHRIILLNFTEREANLIQKAGYNVERGFLGPYVHPAKGKIPIQIPHPIYDYDIMFYTSQVPPDLAKEFNQPQDLLQQPGLYGSFAKFDGPPLIRVSFIGSPTGLNRLLHGGLQFVQLADSERNISSFSESLEKRRTFAIKEVHELLAGFKTQIATVAQFFRVEDSYPFYPFPVLLTRSGETVAGYGTTFERDTVPRYIVLPQLKNNAQAVVEILECLEDVSPVLFPDKVKRDWIGADEFLLPEERTMQVSIDREIAHASQMIETMRTERDRLKKENSFIRRLLVAMEDSSLPIEERLSGLVKRALEFLEFEVEDIDQKTKSAIKKEDFWVRDGDFLGITEVTGTIHKNPKIKEYNDILGRITTIYRRRGDLALPDKAIVTGLLVLNYDIDTPPSKRPRAYTGEEEHIVQAAAEQGIGILSTVELHKVVVAVKEGILSKADARAIVRKPGRIEFDARRPGKTDDLARPSEPQSSSESRERE